jgi:hypothetical protein
VPSIPVTASDHPPRWRFDLPIYHPADLAAWRACTSAPSSRKQMLWWVVSAGKPATRARRIAKIVSEAAAGRRAQG